MESINFIYSLEQPSFINHSEMFKKSCVRQTNAKSYYIFYEFLFQVYLPFSWAWVNESIYFAESSASVDRDI